MADRLEIRIALVMNGGVSLAVWMAGVTHELDLLRRASKGLPAPDAPEERAVYEMWRQLCENLHVEVTVDVVAGSSAGGINGVLLATGIARGAPLSQLREVWEETAQLDPDHLLWPVDQEEAQSVLNGDFFAREVKRIVEKIRPVPREDDTPGNGEDVTLFVTATAVGDQSRQVQDSDGAAFAVPDHRCLYRFVRQPRRSYLIEADSASDTEVLNLFPLQEKADPFENSAALSRAARASASFPGAFAPVPERVFAEPGDPPGLEEYRVAGSDGAWLMDGGVLDNAPFGPVLEEIARRPVDDVWRRALVYVVPSVAGDHAAEPTGNAPGWQSVALSTLLLPREVDLRSDIEALKTLMAEAERWGGGQQRLFAELRRADDELRASYRAAAVALFDSYRRSRLNGGITDVFREWADNDMRGPIGVATSTDTLDAAQAYGWVPSSGDDIGVNNSWNWGTAVADRVLRLMLRDIAAADNRAELSSESRRNTLRSISTRLECVTAVRDAIIERIRDLAPAEPDATAAVNAVNQAIAELRVRPTLARLVREGAEAYASATPARGGDAPESRDSEQAQLARSAVADALTAEVLTGAFTADRAFSRPVPFAFFRFGPDVESPLFAARDPENENNSLPLGPWKLWGTQLANFAAFGRSDWRENDWLWGRLDGAAHLVRLLISQAGATGPNQADTVKLIQTKILATHGEQAQERVQRDLQQMPTLTFPDVLRQWAGDVSGSRSVEESIDSVLRTLRNEDNGNNITVASIGKLATILIGTEVPPSLRDEWTEKVKRLASEAFGLRNRLADFVLTNDSDGDAGGREE